MPRDTSGVYFRPAGIDGIPNHSIESAKYNLNVADVETDLNTPRPIVAGGTGATSASGARVAIGAEVGAQVVSNYDSHTFENGSFVSFTGATAAPTAGDNFTGSCVLLTPDRQFIALQAISMAGVPYLRLRTSGAWQPWQLSSDPNKVSKAGDTMTGGLILNNGTTDSPEIVWSVPGFSWAIDNLSGNLRFYDGGGPVRLNIAPGTGNVNISSTTASNSATTGALTVAGGVGISGNLAGTTFDFKTGPNRHLAVRDNSSNTELFSATDGFAAYSSLWINGQPLSLNVSAGFDVAVGSGGSGRLNVAYTTGSTSPTTGALTCAGGLGLQGNIYMGGDRIVASNGYLINQAANQVYLRSAQINFQGAGGTPQYGVWNGTALYVQNTTASTSPTTGALTVAGGIGCNANIEVGGSVNAAYGFYIRTAGGTEGRLVVMNNVGTEKAYFGWFGDDSVRMRSLVAAADVIISSSGIVTLGKGLIGRAGIAGAYDTNAHNFYWTGSAGQMWIDNSNFGNIQTVCDYRIKKDVAPLDSTWAAVKALRPITYTQREYTPPGAAQPLFVNDNTWQWGFVAHELQETLLPSAASGTKDSPTDIQSPNMLAIVAALTRALQEAMARIEALEAR
jgi:Chaperone of endosialidase